jgi:hypothetical protein
MLRDIFKSLKLIWIFFRAIRTGISGFILALTAAFFIAPPTTQETGVLNLSQSATARDEALIIHRLAKVATTVDSDKLYKALAEGGGTDLTPNDYRFLTEKFADGSLRLPDGANLASNTVAFAMDGSPAPSAADNDLIRDGIDQWRAADAHLETQSDKAVAPLVEPVGNDSILAPRTGGAKFVAARNN